jgi:hypothetical protein
MAQTFCKGERQLLNCECLWDIILIIASIVLYIDSDTSAVNSETTHTQGKQYAYVYTIGCRHCCV